MWFVEIQLFRINIVKIIEKEDNTEVWWINTFKYDLDYISCDRCLRVYRIENLGILEYCLITRGCLQTTPSIHQIDLHLDQSMSISSEATAT